MAGGLLTELSIYSFLAKGALVLVSVLYSNSGTRITCKENNESKEIKTQTHVDLFNVDISQNLNDGEKNSYGSVDCKR